MAKYKIIWADDEIKKSILEPYIDEFADNDIAIIKVDNVDDLLPTIREHAGVSLIAILIDIIMPPHNLDYGKTRGGLRTGVVLLELILGDDYLCNYPVVVVTNSDDAFVTDYCRVHSLPWVKKEDFFTDTFVARIKELVGIE